MNEEENKKVKPNSDSELNDANQCDWKNLKS
jgi:hypothetical protein